MDEEKRERQRSRTAIRVEQSTNEDEASLIHPLSLIPHSLKEIVIYSDGSSLGNGQAETRAAAVALLNYRDLWRAVGLYLGTATNQQAEIAAAALGLETLREPCRVVVHTDSRYVVETMCGRFRRKSNHEWWARLDKAASAHRIEWRWLKGHAGHHAQEAVDKAARRIATLGHADEAVLREAAETVGSAS
ncbi:MAG: ribonuclease HI [Pyrinomonadaceae bacterium]|nr:ribonuclease HI [Pyrinomonadaceae bacterium]